MASGDASRMSAQAVVQPLGFSVGLSCSTMSATWGLCRFQVLRLDGAHSVNLCRCSGSCTYFVSFRFWVHRALWLRSWGLFHPKCCGRAVPSCVGRPPRSSANAFSKRWQVRPSARRACARRSAPGHFTRTMILITALWEQDFSEHKER